MCPMCLSTNVTEKIYEKSSERQTADYVIARRIEWWNIQVPHCSACKKKLDTDHAIGFITGAASIGAAGLLLPPTEFSLLLLCYIIVRSSCLRRCDDLAKGYRIWPVEQSS